MFLSNQYDDMPMPLLIGDWRLFIDKKLLLLRFHNMDNSGHFSSEIHNLIGGGGGLALRGEGFWNELAKQLSFSVFIEIPNSPEKKIIYFFNGYQIEGTSTNDPASDKLWTLSGTYQVSTIGEFLQNIPGLLGLSVQDSRRQKMDGMLKSLK
jgi:hypothetical protein